MKKRGKYKINSGNTFRFGITTKFYRNYARHQHVIIKHMKNIDWSDEAQPECLKNALAQFFDDGGLGRKYYTVTYTMNKRKRWLLPALISEAIDEVRNARISEVESPRKVPAASTNDNSCRVWDDLDITLVERAIFPRWSCYDRVLQNTCTGYHDSRQPLTHVRPRGKFSFEADLKAKADQEDELRYYRSERARRARERQVNRSDQEQRDEMWGIERLPVRLIGAHPINTRIPQVTYEICHPGKLLPHKKNSDASHDDRFCYYGRYRWRRCSWRKSLHKTKGEVKISAIQAMDCIEGGISQHFNRLHDKQVESPIYVPDHSHITAYNYDMVAALDDALVCKKYSPRNRRQKSQKSQKADHLAYNTYSRTRDSNTASSHRPAVKYGKGCCIYIDNPSLDHSESEPDDVFDTYEDLSRSEIQVDLRCKMDPCQVRLSRAETTTDRLCEEFGQVYTEGHSLPRRLMLDLGQLLLQTLQYRLHTEQQFLLNTGLLLVLEEVKCWQYCTSTKPFRCHIESGLSSTMLMRIQKQLIYFISTQEDPISVVTITTLIVDWLHDDITILDALVCQEPSHKPSLILWPRSEQTSSSHTAMEAYHMINHHLLKEQTEVKSSAVQPCHVYRRTISQAGHLDYCDICYDHLISHGDDGVDVSSDLDGVAMVKCQHWFCVQCWQSHLVSRIQRGDINIKCPGYECDVAIDDVMIVSLLPYEYYQRHLNHLTTARLESSSQWKWCPRPGCGRVGTVSHDGGTTVTAVMCRCGLQWCFNCEQNNHWPATCTQAGVYSRILTQKYAAKQENLMFYVDVKKCPFCRQPIEKGGGCQHMHCSKCRGDFCWECLGEWSDHQSITCKKSFVAAQTVEIDHQYDVNLNEFYIRHAMDYRKMRYEALKLTVVDIIKSRTFKNVCRREWWRRRRAMREAWCVFSEDICPIYPQAWTFLLQGLYLLEHIHVVLSNCTKKQRTPVLLNEVARFEFIINQIQKVFSIKSANLEQEVVERLLNSGKQCSTDILWRVKITQKRMDAGKKILANSVRH